MKLLHVSELCGSSFDDCWLDIGSIVDVRSSDFSFLNWSDIGRREMTSNRADSVGLEYTTKWNHWSPRCSPQFLQLFAQGRAAVNQRVAATWLPVEPSRRSHLGTCDPGNIVVVECGALRVDRAVS